MLKIENRGCHGTGSEKSFNLNIMLVLLKVLSDPLSKLFVGELMLFPDLMNRHSQESNQCAIGPFCFL